MAPVNLQCASSLSFLVRHLFMLILMEFLIMFTGLDRHVLISACRSPTSLFVFGIHGCVCFLYGSWTSDIFRDLTHVFAAAFFDVRTSPKKKDGSPFGLPISRWFSYLDDLNTAGVSHYNTHLRPTSARTMWMDNCTNATLKSLLMLTLLLL